MSTYSTNYATGAISDDATFRTRGKFISDSLEAAGFTKVTDASQVNWTTVTRAAGANTSQGYEMRKSNDGLTDFYVKIEYGSGSANTQFAIWITTGTGQDGAGNLTGTVSTRTQVAGATSTAANIDYVSATSGRIAIAHYVVTGALSQVGWGIVIQRTTDSSGADTATGWAFICFYNGGSKNQFVAFAGGAASQRTGVAAFLLAGSVYPGAAGSIPVLPGYLATPSDFLCLRDLVIIPTAYAGAQSQHTLSLLGSNRTFIAVWGGGTYYFIDQGASPMIGNFSLAMRWE